MRAQVLPRLLTAGERKLALAVLVMAMFGAAAGLMTAVKLGHGGVIVRGLGLYDIWIILSGALGGAVGLWLMRDRLGQPGMSGATRAAMGLIGLCFLAPLIGGSLALPVYGTMFGPFTLAVIVAGSPVLAFFLIMTLTIVHILLLGWQAERDSIFSQRLDRMQGGRRRA